MTQAPTDPIDVTHDGAPLWQIVSVRDVQSIVQGSGVIPAKRITFTIVGSREQYSLDVPDPDFSPERVGELVHQRAATIAAVLALQGPSLPPAYDPSAPTGY